MSAHPLVRFFAPDPRHDGVRPVQIWGLRLFFLLMLVFVAPYAWRVLLTHEGPWDPVRAVAFAVWATYPALALFGVFRPLRWLPLMFFTIGYKAIWLGVRRVSAVAGRHAVGHAHRRDRRLVPRAAAAGGGGAVGLCVADVFRVATAHARGASDVDELSQLPAFALASDLRLLPLCASVAAAMHRGARRFTTTATRRSNPRR